MLEIKGPFRLKKVFHCAQCGEKIEFNSPSAVTFEGELFCDNECAFKFAHIEPVLWWNVGEYECVECISNGFGVCRFGPDWFSNGRYAIFKPLGADLHNEDGLKYMDELALAKVRETFKFAKFKQLTLNDVIFFRDCFGIKCRYIKCLGLYVNHDYFDFVIKYCDFDGESFFCIRGRGLSLSHHEWHKISDHEVRGVRGKT